MLRQCCDSDSSALRYNSVEMVLAHTSLCRRVLLGVEFITDVWQEIERERGGGGGSYLI